MTNKVKIVGAMMATNRRHESALNIKKTLPYVDNFVLVDGGSGEDESIIFFRNLEKREPKFKLYVNFFEYDFPKQRNFYLDKAKEFIKTGDNVWVLVMDSDEVYTLAFLRNMRGIIQEAENLGANCIATRCRSVWTEGGEVVETTLDNFWRLSLVKLFPETHYVGDRGHESISQPNMKVASCGDDYIKDNFDETIQYLNCKEKNGSIWIRGMRNATCWGGGKNLHDKNMYYVEWRKLISPYFNNTYPKFDDQLRWFAKGQLPQDVKDWLLNRARTCDIGDGASEIKEIVKTYFLIYHPEELPPPYTIKQIEDL